MTRRLILAALIAATVLSGVWLAYRLRSKCDHTQNLDAPSVYAACVIQRNRK